MKYTVVLAIIFFSLLANISFAIEIKNPTSVSYMKAEVVQNVSLTFDEDVTKVILRLYVPQDDAFQKVEGTESDATAYKEVRDAYGNRQLEFTFQNPPKDLKFKVKTLVSINRRFTQPEKKLTAGEYKRPTELIQSTDKDIGNLAELLSLSKGSDSEKISSLSSWINENIQYDLNYSEVNVSAKQVLNLRRGVCDEFSTLLLSMARNLGYYSSYVVGYVYGRGYTFAEGQFSPHGWTEISTNQGLIPVDPTWGESGYLDAAHIVFARLPDSGAYPEVNITIFGFGVSKNPKLGSGVNVNILDAIEEPMVQHSSSLVDNKIWEGYALVKTELSSSICAGIKIRISGCVDSATKKPFFENPPDRFVFFCKNKTIFSPMKVSIPLDKNKIYTCPITVYVDSGKQAAVSSTLDPGVKPGNVRLSVGQSSVKEGDVVSVSAPGAFIFTSGGISAVNQINLVAEKSFTVYAYNTGALAGQNITVSKAKPFEAELSINETLFVGKGNLVNFSLANKLGSTQSVEASLANDTRKITLPPLESTTIFFNFTPTDTNDNLVQVFYRSDSFSASVSKIASLREPEKKIEEKIASGVASTTSSIFQKIADFFASIARFFSGIIR